jgi:hypothetical protein
VTILIRTYGAKPELFVLSNELADLMVILKEGIQSYKIDPTAVDRNPNYYELLKQPTMI